MRMFNPAALPFAAFLLGLASVSPRDEGVEAPGLPAEIWKLMRGSFTIRAWNPAVSECIEEKNGDTISRT